MDTDNTYDTPSTLSSFLPLGLTIASLGLALVALIFAWTAKKNNSEAHNGSIPMHDAISAFEKRLAFLEAQNDELSDQNQFLKASIATLVEQTQTALNQIGKEITANREQLSNNAQSLQKLAYVTGHSNAGSTITKTSIAQPATSITASNKNLSSSTSTTKKYHIIQPGDTLARIARQYNIPLATLVRNNPQVDPRKLYVGQKIVIP